MSGPPISDRVDVEVAHEALIRHWPTLRGWLDEDRSSLLLRQSVREAAHEWERSGREESYLVHRGRKLDETAHLHNHPRVELNALERGYLEASVALRAKQQAAVESRRRRVIAGLTCGLVVALVLATIAGLQWREAAMQRAVAEEESDRANEERLQSLSRQLQAQARDLAGEEFDLALLLGLQADRFVDSLEAKGAMLTVLQANPHFERYIPVDSSAVRGLALSPVDHVLASTSDSGAVRLWNLGDGTSRILSEGRLTWASAPSFSADGRTLAAGGCGQMDEAEACERGEIILWDVASGEEQARFRCPAIPYNIAWSPDGRYLGVSCGLALYGWDLSRDGKDRKAEPRAGIDLFAVSPAPDSPYLAVDSGDDDITVFNTGADEEHAVLRRPQPFPAAQATDMTFSPDGKTLAVSYDDAAIYLWDVESGALADDPLIAASSVVEVAFSPDGATIAGLDLDGALSLWDVQTGQLRGAPISGHRGGITSFALAPNDVLVTGGADGRLARWDLGAEYRVGHLLMERFLTADAAFSADSRRLAVVTGDITMWDLETRQKSSIQFTTPREISRPHFNPRCLAFAPDGKTLAAGTIDGAIVQWDTETGQQRGEAIFADEREGILGCTIAYSPNGQLLAFGLTGWDHAVTLWNPASRERMQSLTTPSLKRAEFSPDSRRLLTLSMAYEAWLWDVAATPATSTPVEPERGGVVDGAFWSERLLMTVSNDGSVWRVDVSGSPPMYEPIASLTVDPERIALSPGSGLFATGGQQGGLQLFDVASGRAISELTEGQGHKPIGLAFSPDGRWLVAWTLLPSRKMVLWDVGFASWQTQACALAGRNLTREEWDRFVGADFPYTATCPAVPLEDAPSGAARGTPQTVPPLAIASPAP
jgi:WD40 repeat protein